LLEGAAAELATASRDQNAIDELEALYEQMADVIEAEGRWLDVVRLNQAFHERLYADANSPILLEILERLWRRIPWAAVGGASVEGRTHGMLEEHADILRAVKARDPAIVADRIREHCRNGSKRVAGYLEAKQRGTATNLGGIPGSER
jgi:DNA-binding GntR family transcriptional regulator